MPDTKAEKMRRASRIQQRRTAKANHREMNWLPEIRRALAPKPKREFEYPDSALTPEARRKESK